MTSLNNPTTTTTTTTTSTTLTKTNETETETPITNAASQSPPPSPVLTMSSSPSSSSLSSSSPPSESTMFSDDTLIQDIITSTTRHQIANNSYNNNIIWSQPYTDRASASNNESQITSSSNIAEHYTHNQQQLGHSNGSWMNMNPTSSSSNKFHYHLHHHHLQTNAPINTDYESSAAEDFGETYTSIKYKNADHALLSYSRTNKLEKLQTLLEAKLKNRDGFNLNLNFRGQQKQNFSWSALHLACYFGHTQVVQLLLSNPILKQEIDVNIQNNSGDTPLHKATLTNRVQIVQILLSNGANVSIKNCDGLLAKQLTNDGHILDMLEAAEKVDKNRTRQDMFKAVDNGDLDKLREFFINYDSYYTDDATRSLTEQEQTRTSNKDSDDKPSSTSTTNQQASSQQSCEGICQLTDERGNTLLHLAAMRGFKAICVYLLEQGLDPYKRNNLGQSCIDLSSYQLRQLFTTVKPANSRLKRLSNSRVSRFEGPLMKKVRILGWKQIYIVLENGCILLFNNRMDSMNKSRRGYKYLESATCEADSSDIGVFHVSFSDKSRATFLVSSDHLNSYTSFKLGLSSSSSTSSSDQEKSSSTQVNQVELIRQKWINSIRDHIRYSTEFIKNGLKLNDYDEENEEYRDGNIASLNHLLPIDTIKSFMQEARAHYSILDRHASSLCSLIQSINAANRSGNSMETIGSSNGDQEPEVSEYQASAPQRTSGTGAGNRILNFIRPSRQNRADSMNNDDSAGTNTTNQVVQNLTGSLRKQNSNLTNEFIQDNWHCILFHLRLLMESTENTKVSMGQALALIEHQEQLRQNKIQDQDERCRVLEDSLHALARDHHELEKSISNSQLFHSARSMSMSTDLNEFFDAFEDFDDDKTMTPDSAPSDEDLNRKIQDVLDEEEAGSMMTYQEEDDNQGNQVNASLMRFANQVSIPSSSNLMEPVLNSNGSGRRDGNYVGRGYDGTDDDEDEEDDDLRSNCSALTAETVSEITSDGSRRLVRLGADDSLNIIKTNTAMEQHSLHKHRTRLPSPMVPRDQISIWSILKNCIGKELSKITMPVVFNEPLTMLQRASEMVQYSRYLKMADECDDPVERMEIVSACVVASLSSNCHRIIKPFNPLLYETFEFEYELEDGSKVKTLAQQVSHHPPITAAYAESDNFIHNGSVNPKLKFWGRSIEVQPDGQCRIYLKRRKESYIYKSVSCSIHNIIVGKLWFEHSGPLDIRCVETNLEANLNFKPAGWFGNDIHRFDGVIVSGLDKKSSERKKLRYVYGKWSDYFKTVDYAEYENYMKESQQKLFRIPDKPDINRNMSSASSSKSTNGLTSSFDQMSLSNSVNNNSIKQDINTGQQQASNSKSKSMASKSGDKKSGYTKSDSIQSIDIPNSRTLWRLESQYLEEYYNFTFFTLRLNELTPDLEKTLPKTDSRFRLDVRKLEEGDLDGAASEKQRLEEKQRAARARDNRFKEPSSDFLWFSHEKVPFSNEKFWIYKGGYWENRCNPDKFPDLF